MAVFNDFLKILHLMVAFICIFLLWMLARWLVLPHLQIFPKLPPYPLWEGAYGAVLIAATAVFWIVVCLILFLYVVYKVIEAFVPNLDFPPIRIKDMILGLTPFREMRESGLVALFDNIFFNLIPVPKPIKAKLKDIFFAFRDYLHQSFGFTKSIMEEIGAPVVNKLREGTDKITSGIKTVATTAVKNTATGIKDIGKNAVAPLAPEAVEELPTDPVARMIEEQYRRCVNEKQTNVSEDLPALSRAKLTLINTTQTTKCKIEKMKATTSGFKAQLETKFK